MDVSSLTFQTGIPDSLLNSRIKEQQAFFSFLVFVNVLKIENSNHLAEAQSQRAGNEYNSPFKRTEKKDNKESSFLGDW